MEMTLPEAVLDLTFFMSELTEIRYKPLDNTCDLICVKEYSIVYAVDAIDSVRWKLHGPIYTQIKWFCYPKQVYLFSDKLNHVFVSFPNRNTCAGFVCSKGVLSEYNSMDLSN